MDLNLGIERTFCLNLWMDACSSSEEAKEQLEEVWCFRYRTARTGTRLRRGRERKEQTETSGERGRIWQSMVA